LPDEKRVALTNNNTLGESELFIFDDTSRRLIAARKSPEGIKTPAWSPDGKTMAYSVLTYEGGISSNLETVTVEGGAAQRLGSHKWGQIRGLSWLPDNRGLIAADVASTTKGDVYHVSYPEGKVRKITNDLSVYSVVSSNGNGGELVALQNEVISHIWLIPVDNPSNARQITNGRQDGLNGVAWTPDGRVIFTAPDSNQDSQIWIMATDGTQPRQLTLEGGRTPSVCGDGRYLVYLSYQAGTPHIWRSRLDGSDAKQLTFGTSEFMPSCSPDGTWFTYGSTDPKDEGVFKMPIDGGNPIRIWEKYIGTKARISPDGKIVGILEQGKVILIPAEGGDPVRTFDRDHPEWGTWGGWTLDGRAFLYGKSVDGVLSIWQRNMDGNEPRQLARFDNERISDIGLSHDGKYLAVVRLSSTSDVVLIKDLNVNVP
jgi:Tol biopolymer transport system component